MSAVQSVLDLAKRQGARMVDFKFADAFGAWRRFSIPASQLTAEVFRSGLEVDAAALPGWEAGELLARPDASAAFFDPFCGAPTLSLLCDLVSAETGEAWSLDPRAIARRAEQHLLRTGLADSALFGLETDFFIFDNTQQEERGGSAFHLVDSEEGAWNAGRDENPNLGSKIPAGRGCYAAAPADTQQDLRSEICLVLESLGAPVERQHHAAAGGQGSIALRPETLVKAADALMQCKHAVRNVARKHGKTATFMPQPLLGDSGSGLRARQSLGKKGKPLFSGREYAGLSTMALHFIGGLLQHAPALCALCNPSTNSYRRLASPGAPALLAYSARNRSAAIRVPPSSDAPKTRQTLCCLPDAAANPYLAGAALLMAGLDGVLSKTDPGKPLEKGDLSPSGRKQAPAAPRNLGEALGALEKDHDFLLRGGVFAADFLELWIARKKQEEEALRRRPHPHEFSLYYDV